MNRRMVSIITAVLVTGALTVSIAKTETDSLQNGKNGYKGCKETFVAYPYYDNIPGQDPINHEGEEYFNVKACVS